MGRPADSRHHKGTETLHCSFCNKAHHDVRKLIAGPTANICDECIAVCFDIVADETKAQEEAVDKGAATTSTQHTTLPGTTVKCMVCQLPMLLAEGVVIRSRGVLCPGCVGEIEATLAESRQSGA